LIAAAKGGNKKEQSLKGGTNVSSLLSTATAHPAARQKVDFSGETEEGTI
jgi:hypothetical protein